MSSTLMSRARALLGTPGRSAIALAAVPLAAAAPAGANAIALGDLVLEDSFVGYFNASGFFTEPGFRDDTGNFVSLGATPEGSSIGGAPLGEGFKLFGSAAMDDGVLGEIASSIDNAGENFGNEAYGIAMGWVGSFATTPVEGDVLRLAYEFDIGITDNVDAANSEDGYEPSVFWELHAGFIENCCGDRYTPEAYNFIPTFYSTSGDVYGAGTETFTGEVESDMLFPYEDASYQWGVFLTTYWDDPDAWTIGPNSGDVLTVTVPQNSIDIGLNAVPTASTTPPVVGVPAPDTVPLVALGGLALLALRRRRG